MSFEIFVSYRRDDDPSFAGRLSDVLKETFGKDSVFIDVENIGIGVDWLARVRDAASSCALMIVIIGPHWLDILQRRAKGKGPDIVVDEIATALGRNLSLLPVVSSLGKMIGIGDLENFGSIRALETVNAVKLQHERWETDIETVKQFVESKTHLRRLTVKSADDSTLPSRNTLFSGREARIAEISDFLEYGSSVVLTGMPGIGKSAIALEVAHRQDWRDGVRLWVRAERRGQMLSDLNEVAGRLGIDWSPKDPLSALVETLKEKLANSSRWLLVLDNANADAVIDDIVNHFTGWTAGHLLVTTTRKGLVQIGSVLDVDALSDEDGALVLLRRIGKLRKDQQLGVASDADRSTAMSVSKTVGGLSLALVQAGGFIAEAGVSLSEYLDLFKKQRRELLGKAANSPRKSQASVTITFTLALNHATSKRPAVSDLLSACSFLGAEEIPQVLFENTGGIWGEALPDAAANPVQWINTLSRAYSHSLIGRDPATKSIAIHRVLQSVIIDKMAESERRLWEERTIRAVNRCLIEDIKTEADAIAFHQVVPHALAALQILDQRDDKFALASSLTGRYTLNDFAADQVLQNALADGSSWEKLLGPNVDYDSIYNAAHFRALKSLEGEATQTQMRRVVLSMRRVLTDPREARIAFSAMVLVMHFWWDSYLADDVLLPPLLAMWPHNPRSKAQTNTADGLDEEAKLDNDFEAALRKFTEAYPPLRKYRTRTADTVSWDKVWTAVNDLRKLLEIDAPVGDVSVLSSSERFVRAMSNIYLAEATRYAPSKLSRNERCDLLWPLYDDSLELLDTNGDNFHLNWARFDYAEALAEAGMEENTQDTARSSALLKHARELNRLALDGALNDAGEESAENGGAYFIDSEVISNTYRLGADIVWPSESRRAEGLALHNAAVVCAFAFLLSEWDSYGVAFYDEQIERASERLAGIENDEAASAYIDNFWSPFWTDYSGSSAQSHGFPPLPSLDDHKYRETIYQFLQSVPDTIAELSASYPGYRPPLYFKARVAKCLKNVRC